MPRRGNVPKREVLPDPLYNSVLVTKLINSIMLDGKKGVAQKVVYGAFDIVEKRPARSPGSVPAGNGEHHARRWRSRPAVSAALPIRCLSRFARTAVRPWVCAG